MKFPLSPMALKWCGPPKKGLEIGGTSWNEFGCDLLNVVTPDPADRAFYDNAHAGMGEPIKKIDIDAEGDDIPVPDSSQDVVLSSHVIEHMPNPIKAFKEWHRVCKPGGIVYCVFPQRNAHHDDRNQPVTSIEGFLLAWEKNYTADTAPGLRRGHYWVWTLDSMKKLIETINSLFGNNLFKIVDEAEKDDKVGNGHVIVLEVIK